MVGGIVLVLLWLSRVVQYATCASRPIDPGLGRMNLCLVRKSQQPRLAGGIWALLQLCRQQIHLRPHTTVQISRAQETSRRRCRHGHCQAFRYVCPIQSILKSAPPGQGRTNPSVCNRTRSRVPRSSRFGSELCFQQVGDAQLHMCVSDCWIVLLALQTERLCPVPVRTRPKRRRPISDFRRTRWVPDAKETLETRCDQQMIIPVRLRTSRATHRPEARRTRCRGGREKWSTKSALAPRTTHHGMRPLRSAAADQQSRVE
jgi:hypothetical protein